MEARLSLPCGPFDLIYADCPWKYRYSLPSEGQNIEGRHYDCMTVEELLALPMAAYAAKDAVLLLWATCPKLQEALAVLNGWGFSYRQQMIWEKLSPKGRQNHGMGHWLKSNHEIILLGVRGEPGAPQDRKKRPHSVFRAPRRRHSQKPDEVYGYIDAMFPHLTQRLELFARGEPRPGWSAWGNEVDQR